MAKPKGKSAPHQGSLSTKLTSKAFNNSKIPPKTTMYITSPFFPVRCLVRFVNQGLSKSVETTVAQQLPAAARKETMKSVSVFACAFSLTALTALSAPPAFADTDLATKKNCMACHAIDKKQVGPSYKDVATKYAGQKDAVEKLTQKVMKGGAGVWGAIPMPANPQVSDVEAQQLVEWIMSQK